MRRWEVAPDVATLYIRTDMQPSGHATDVDEPLEGRYGEEAFDAAAELFRTLGDPERLRLLTLLAGGERTVTELAQAAGAGLSVVSQRLRVLRLEGLLTRRRDGRNQYYGLADRHVADLITNALAHASEHRHPGDRL